MDDDRYRWLEDPSSPETVSWVGRRDAEFARAARTWTARGRFTGSLRRLCADRGSASAPRPAGGRLFRSVLRPGGEHPVVEVVEPGGEVRVLFDPLWTDPAGGTTLEAWEPAWDGRLLAYQVAGGGTEHSSLYVLDVDTGAVVDGPIDRVRRTTVAWLPDGTGFYYVRRLDPALNPGEEQYHRRVYLHTLGTPPADDTQIFGDGRDKTQHYTVAIAADGRWLVLTASAGTSPRKDVWIADLAATDPGKPVFTAVQEGVDARTSLHIRPGTGADGACYVLTDLDAGRGRLAVTTPGNPTPETWVDLVGEDPEAVLEDFAVLDDPRLARPLLLLAWTRHAVGEITVHDLADGRRLATPPVPGLGSIGRLRAAASAGGEAWFVFSTFTASPVVYRFDAGTGAVERWDPPGAAAPAEPATGAEITARQVVYPSRDGTPVRMFVFAPPGDRPDRPRPAILTGYGGFGVSMTPAYAPEIVAWVAAGGVYALANLRGGGEEGEAWHRAGMRARKQNTFDDFHAAADHLTAQGWTTPARLGIWGSSNGGLLVGAALTQHPEKYAAVVCVAPLLDMARYEESGLGPSWVEEYGTAADPEQRGWLMSYSPYHHVRAGRRYPAALFMVFDGDSRVDPLHARKMCAALRDASTSGEPVLFRLERGVGHGARATSSQVGLLADLLAFLYDRVGVGGG
ncbi:prolyl oligopeptidase family serine peptidase [Phytohabitans sp. ZYX-F-186]|uniref:prolyl oligopeptidase n=1 Tax=Phytohabitans maris TaxID=3071409 RepID=A0ABU0ZWB3_9ACTN|nr:prolyl oligopeptidase family serine peptidase [Phytohabitans sp. ZYX-F-186]MDQ7911323.1 prolyl oligopeptidase family serine peptidase [Phytohabitans sp. ZYX-F-186]